MNGNKEQQSYMSEQAKPTRHPSQVHMHSLLNVKLASLAENSYHNTMTPDAIASYYDESPDCSPPNGYHSPNPSPPNGFHSPNPTPPNGYLANTHAVFHDIVNPPIMFYGDDTVMGYDEDQFMKTMRILTSAHQYNDLQHHHHHHQPSPTQRNLEHQQQQRQRLQQEQQRQIHQQQLKQKQQQQQQKTQVAEKKQESISLESIKDDTKTKEATPAAENSAAEELEIINNEEASSSVRRPPVLTKEDKRRRNTQASARFRVKKKLREQALQNTANEMTEKANRLQNRVHELEREVQWLKALVVEKKDSRFFTH